MEPLGVTLKLEDPDALVMKLTDFFLKQRGYRRVLPATGQLVMVNDLGEFAAATDEEILDRYLNGSPTSLAYWTEGGFDGDGDECLIGFGHPFTTLGWYSISLDFRIRPQPRAIAFAAEYVGWIGTNLPSLAEDQAIYIVFERSGWGTPPRSAERA